MFDYHLNKSISKQTIGVQSVSSELSVDYRVNCSYAHLKTLLSNFLAINRKYRCTICSYRVNYRFNYRCMDLKIVLSITLCQQQETYDTLLKRSSLYLWQIQFMR